MSCMCVCVCVESPLKVVSYVPPAHKFCGVKAELIASAKGTKCSDLFSVTFSCQIFLNIQGVSMLLMWKNLQEKNEFPKSALVFWIQQIKYKNIRISPKKKTELETAKSAKVAPLYFYLQFCFTRKKFRNLQNSKNITISKFVKKFKNFKKVLIISKFLNFS